MSSTDIFVARHGQTEYNRTARIQGRGINKSLNGTGYNQAQSIARSLQNADIQHIFSSSLKRSIETAQIIADALQVSVQSYPELDEMDFGVIEGRPIKEIEDELHQLHTSWRGGDTAFALERGESPDAVLERVLRRLNIILKNHRGQRILFVLHGRLIRIVLSHWLEYGLTGMHLIEHQNGALYHLRLDENEKMEPVFLNKTEHLELGS